MMTTQFTCANEECGKKLEARLTTSSPGAFGMGGYSAKCPFCGTETGSFTEKVLEVVEVLEES